MYRLRNHSGYSLVEMVLVIVILGILSAITMRSLQGANDARRIEETRSEMDRLAWAIAGNPELIAEGHRADYGYIGDNGALPPDLNALIENPGLATWDGPYIQDGAAVIDAWGKPYQLEGHTITSVGSGADLTRAIAADAGKLLNNTVTVVVRNLSSLPPGARFRDSLRVVLTLPDGAGGTVNRAAAPKANGLVQFDSIPIGLHPILLVYLPSADTLRRQATVDPGSRIHLDWVYPSEEW